MAAAAAAVEASIQQLLAQSVQEGLLDDQFLQLIQLQVRHGWAGLLGHATPGPNRRRRRPPRPPPARAAPLTHHDDCGMTGVVPGFMHARAPCRRP